MDFPNGKGVFRDINGSLCYDGEFKDGVKDGIGIYKYPLGSVYEGNFKNDVIEGRGILRKSGGDV